MLLEVYVLFQIIAVGAIIATFYSEAPLIAALSMLSSGTLMIGAWFLDVGIAYTWDPSIAAYTLEHVYVNTPYLATINFALFGLSLAFFYYDLFVDTQKKSKGLGNVRMGGNSADK